MRSSCLAAVQRKRMAQIIAQAKHAELYLQAKPRCTAKVVLSLPDKPNPPCPKPLVAEAGPLPRGTKPEHESAPSRVRTATAIIAAAKRTSRTIAVKAKPRMPPRQHVKMLAKMRYRHAAPEMPSTALIHVAMASLRSDNTARNYIASSELDEVISYWVKSTYV